MKYLFIFILFLVGWAAADFMYGGMDWKGVSAAALGWIACVAQLKLNGLLK